MEVKKEYMKIFSRNLFLNRKKSKKIEKEVSEEIDEILSRYDDDRVAYNEELEGAIPRALRITEENAEYFEDMGFVNALKFSGKVPHFNIRSKMEIGGLPVFNIASGYNPEKGDYDVAKGIIAVGSKARGIIAMGKMAYGVVAIGALSIGVLSFGILSAGVFSVAGIAFALLLALGGVSISAIISMGIVALSSLAASGQFAMAHFVNTANQVSENMPGWFAAISNNISTVILVFEIILIVIGVSIFYLDNLSRNNYDK